MTVWNMRFLALAYEISRWSKDPSTQVGAVITRPDNTIASMGYNGFPRKMIDDPARYEDREEKYDRIIHAEVNAILNSKEDLNGYTLYITIPPCPRCAVQIIQSGITRVVWYKPAEYLIPRWGRDFQKTRDYFNEAGIEYDEVG